MANCFENLPPCVWFEGGERRNAFASILAGFLFFSGWWLIIDANAVHPDAVRGAYHVCGIIGTVSLFMINAVSNAQVRGDSFSGGCMGPRGARTWLFVGFVLGFAAVIASCWILFADFFGPNGKSKAAGIALFLQNLFIFGGSLVYKFGRAEEQWG
ncbi:transmembrane protein 50A [Lycorma delicatula]|uniref:transmembrane protein 50A n=1 Tax=Lycorma delicatula TaxID=130591 RepID=UPI003F51768A